MKICDFGLSRSLIVHEKHVVKGNYTQYVTTRIYRAPELLFAENDYGDYSEAIDVFSLGCIFAEMLK